MKKELIIVGLGKMGGAMAHRMIEKGWKIIGMDRNTDTLNALSNEGIIPATDFKDASSKTAPTRIVWLFLPPQNDAVDEALFGDGGIADTFSPGDVVIDGGNSFFRKAPERAEKLAEKGIRFMDVGTSGGPSGARNGACLMIGGSEDAFSETEELFKDFSKDCAYQFFKGPGAGHFVKMIHNGIEYGMMQALGEGFEVLKKSDFKIDLTRAAEIYNNGSVIESRLVGWLKKAFEERGEELEGVSSTVSHTGEGEWTVKTANEMGVDVPVIRESFDYRVQSANNPHYTGKVVSALREQFGGHDVKEKSA